MGVTAHVLFYFIDGRMIMADTVSFDSLLNTTAGMTAVVNNTEYDDDVVSVTGVDWFTYAGKTASTIYVSGNNFIGFGQNAEQLKIWRRDGVIYYVYRQEGTLTSGKRFLKIRVEGYVHYSSTASSYALKYEVFLIEGQTLFVNVVQRPTSSSYTGTSSITDGETTTSLNISVSSTVPISILVKNAGVSQEITYEKYSDVVIASITVSKMPDKTTYYQKELFDKTGLEISGTTSTGETVSVTNYELSGFDSSSAGTKTITVTVSGKTTTFEITVSEASITTISVTTMPTKVNYHIGKEFDSTGIVVAATASDGNTIDVTKDCTYSGFDSSSPKQSEITAHYGSFTCTFEVTIMQPEEINGMSYVGASYFVGDTTDIAVSYIVVVYSDGSEKVTSGFTVENKVLTEAGTVTINVNYFGITDDTIKVNVYDSFLVHIGSPNYEDVTAEFNLDTNTLSISGTGKIKILHENSENIIVPDSLFKRCVKITFSDGITEITGGFGYQFESLTCIELGNTITSIAGGNFTTFLGTKLEFPASLKAIQGGTFSSCPNLTEIVFHEGLQEIQGGTLNGFQSLDSVVFPLSLNLLSSGAFAGAKINNVEIGSTDSMISSSGIYIPSCKSLIIRGGTIDGTGGTISLSVLENLTLKSAVKFIGKSHFSPCFDTLKSVTIESGITEIPPLCFSNCGKITEIKIPASVTNIGESAFSGTSLKNLEIPNGVQTIGKAAFSNTRLVNVSVPASVTTIGEDAFVAQATTNVTLNKKTNEISGSPWGATGTITWLIRVTRLEATHMPTKARYFVGETFDSTGLVITVYYNDNTSEQVTGYTLSSPDMSAYGSKTVTVTFDEKTVDFSILVVDITGIEIKTPPTKQEYLVGNTLDSTGLTVLVKYTDGTSETITSGFTVSELDSSSIGEKEITVAYKNHTATFKVLVYELQGIRITHYPEKTYYRVGETFDPTGLVVAAMRTDNTEKEITDYTVSGFDSSKAGTKTITVSYQTEIGGIETFVGYDEFEIKVTKDGKNPFEDNTDPINVKVHWINGEFEDLTNDNIQSNTLSLQESLCNKAYFIFGGCISNQITFKCYHQQFIGTDETTYPSGKIEVYLECKGTEIKIFTGEIATGERGANSFVRTIVAYDYLYKLRNTDIAWWYKNNTKDKQMVFTQKQFRDALFKYLGIEQVDVKLKYDSAYVPNTANSSEMNVANILEDLCLQNNVFGWMNRDGKFEYKKLKKNCKHRGTTVSGVETFDFYESAVHLDRFKSFKATEGRVWFFNYVYTDPDPSGEIFTSGEPTAQDAYERNVFYNRNSFFVGNQDWLNYAYDANEYGDYTRTKPKYAICYGTVAEDIIKKQYYRAQGYSVEVQGNPFNMVGQTVEMTHSKLSEDGSAIQWVIHSYIMSRTLKLGITGLIDTYTANNSPYNGNNQQLGKNTPEITSTINRTRSEMPTISYAEFTDGTESGIATIDDFTDGSGSSSTELKKAQLRCVKRIKKADYDALVAAGTDRKDTLYFTYE
jgi:hypothetical protein